MNTHDLICRLDWAAIEMGRTEERFYDGPDLKLLKTLPLHRIVEAFTLLQATGDALPLSGCEVLS